MAKNYKHTKTVSNTIKVKGEINCDNENAFIIYDNDGEEYTVNVFDLFSQFQGETINLMLSTKDETDIEG